MKVRKITRYEFSVEEGSDVTDIEFVPASPGCYEVWVSGVFIEVMEHGARPSEVRAQYYYEVHGQGLAERIGAEPIAQSEPPPSDSNNHVHEAAMH